MMSILITGAAGFVGFFMSLKLLAQGREVIGVDNINNYYDIELKKNRLKQLNKHPTFTFLKIDITDRVAIEKIFAENNIDMVIHFAAQAGVRYSVSHPHVYGDVNLVGFLNVLEASRQHHIKHFIFASSSSVYGANIEIPFSEDGETHRPLSLYAATKKANELMAYSYAHLYKLPCTGLRFFTVYGPWGRPDMALFSFTNDILSEKPITVFNNGEMLRDFTYIDDVIEGVSRIINLPSINSDVPYRVYNLGNNNPVQLKYFIEVLEKNLGKKANIHFQSMHAADVVNTYANMTALEKVAGQLPHTTIEVGVARFVEWYKQYYQVAIFC
ncbi:MAG: hypothetical protein A3E81_01495 [Gammaproteobacteria bacterium RIFCSPHIGHO2_12_FULL_36_30]|nr:MAG: hypothetical protein A3E81_01495 [Gammaproteobacteria bacterium RIFCSPHIGHO2_12_FULL_36_30]